MSDKQQYEQQPCLLRRSSLYMVDFDTSSKTRASSITSDTSTSSSTSGSSSDPLLFVSLHSPSSDDSSAGPVTTSRKQQSRGRRGQRHHRLPFQTKLLRLLWFLSVLAGEHGAFWIMARRCVWPENSTWDDSASALRERYRVVIIADPQLTDWFSYKQSGLRLWLTEFYTDIFMRRSFARLHQRLQPDAVLFLGDLMDGGKETTDEKVFAKNHDRFLEKVFDSRRTAWNQRSLVMDNEVLHGQEEQKQRTEENGTELYSQEEKAGTEQAKYHRNQRMQNEEPITGHFLQVSDVPLKSEARSEVRASGRSVRLYVAGNHDVGFGDTLIRKAMNRYKGEFGSVNYEIQVGNHSLVILDTLALSSNITSVREESQVFLSQMERENSTTPRILFTHMPLFRLETTYCGEGRENRQLILERNGDQFQNMVDASLSREILRKIQPDMVFSGDDHDCCEIAHSLDGRLTPEVTLPTFNFAQGSMQPGFVMLSLYNPERRARNVAPMIPKSASSFRSRTADAWAPGALGRMATMSDNTTFAYEECLLPRQMSIYSGYSVLFGITAVWLAICRFRRLKRYRQLEPVLVRWRKPAPLASMVAGRPSNSTPHPLDDAEVHLLPQRSTTTKYPCSRVSQLHSNLHQQEQQQQDCVDEKRLQQHFIGSSRTPSPLRAWSPPPLLDDWRHGKLSTSAPNCIWPLQTQIFWEGLVWDLISIFQYIVPFYLCLLLVSLL